MKKNIIALSLVLLTLGLCVCCDADVDNKLLGGESGNTSVEVNKVTVLDWNNDTTVKTLLLPTEYVKWEDLNGVTIDDWTFTNDFTFVYINGSGVFCKDKSNILSPSTPIENNSIVYYKNL